MTRWICAGCFDFLLAHDSSGAAPIGLPWVGVLLVGAVITLNVALGGMKGITLVQAFQYWAKMFAISVPIFVLMAVYGHYGKQLGEESSKAHRVYGSKANSIIFGTNAATFINAINRFPLSGS